MLKSRKSPPKRGNSIEMYWNTIGIPLKYHFMKFSDTSIGAQ